jgi:hypothetical protein
MRLRKRLFCFLVVAAICGHAAAQEGDDGVGLTAGLELGLANVDRRTVLGITPYVVYEKSFGNLDVYGELDYTMELARPVGNSLYLEGELGYNIPFNDIQKLSFIVNNQDTFFIAPPLEAPATHEGTLEPSAKYTHTLGFGDLYGQIGLPVDYMTGIIGEISTGAYLRLGWASGFGLGLELTGNIALSPESGYDSTGLLVSYESGSFYGEIEIEVDRTLGGISVKPEVDLSLIGSWTFVIRAEIEKVGRYSTFRPFIGAQYSF